MLRTFSSLLVLANILVLAALPACAISDDSSECTGGKCDGPGGGVCTDKRYGDGTCDLSTDCAAPDIDCFRTFSNDEEAATWYGAFEAKLAAEQGTPPRAILSSSDPRFPKIRDLVDRGWAAFRTNRPVGRLGDLRPAVVFVEDAAVNAFVAPDLDLKRAGFAVMVHTGLLGISASDDAMLGLMMHELEHAVGLQVIPEVKSKFNRFYVAPANNEPIGRKQVEDARARTAGTTWIAAGHEIGSMTNAELGGIPPGGDLFRILRTVVASGLQTNPTGCQHSRELINQISADAAAAADPLSGAVTLNASMHDRATAAMTALRDECLPTFTMSFVQVVAQIAGVTPEQIDATIDPADRPLITDKHVVDAIAGLTENRRAKMRGIETAFASEVGRPWSALRYFSTEEDADDTSVVVLRGASFDPTGLGTFFRTLLPDATKALCEAALAGEVPPYGADLVDDHHATCWRIYHVNAYADDLGNKSAERAARPQPQHQSVVLPPRLLPPALRDLVMH